MSRTCVQILRTGTAGSLARQISQRPGEICVRQSVPCLGATPSQTAASSLHFCEYNPCLLFGHNSFHGAAESLVGCSKRRSRDDACTMQGVGALLEPFETISSYSQTSSAIAGYMDCSHCQFLDAHFASLGLHFLHETSTTTHGQG